jgi:hypothetical protein
MSFHRGVKTYDALIRVSKMNGRKESAESTMTLDDQDAAIRRSIKEAKARRGLTLEALDQSGFTIHRSDVTRRSWSACAPARAPG